MGIWVSFGVKPVQGKEANRFQEPSSVPQLHRFMARLPDFYADSYKEIRLKFKIRKNSPPSCSITHQKPSLIWVNRLTDTTLPL
ncbi:hypothetical protein OUZ56_002026 [Daphnia magna]|uniref:Uncharacterized protein n=1 Tax=Daphnia magna TaxID=35525 RepID=A0ABR0A4G7_9CRUS|nr:hypothetical protein OUZ56_002026 [Daphnia magna]